MDANFQVFLISAESRNDPTARPLQFLIEAESHREAWRIARESCKTGRGAKVRDPVTQQLEPYDLKPNAFTVKRVLSTSQSRRGRPPKVMATDLVRLAEGRGVRITNQLKKVINELAT